MKKALRYVTLAGAVVFGTYAVAQIAVLAYIYIDSYRLPPPGGWTPSYPGFWMERTTHRDLMDDPLFTIRYDPQTEQFENLPTLLLTQCEALKGRYNGAWIYGHAKTPRAEYFLVSGLMEGFNEGTGKSGFYPDKNSLIVAVSGSTCAANTQDDLNWIKDSPIWYLSETTFNNLVADIFRRYSDAFGSKREFLRKIPSDRSYLLPELRTRLEAFEKEP